MSRINDIALGLDELESDLAGCARCGMCLAACPLYPETGREGDSARGKLALVDGLAERLFTSPRGVAQRLDRCLLCGSCTAVCPNGVDASRIFLKARMILASARGLPSVEKYVLKKMLADRRTRDRVMRWSGRLGKWVTQPESPLTGTASFRFPWSIPMLRHFVPPARRSFQESRDPMPAPVSSAGPTVLFFLGCLIDRFFPRIAQAALAVFCHHGINVIIPEAQGCCGLPSAAAGDGETAKGLIRHHLALFSELRPDAVVTACGTCTHAMKKIWPDMMRADGEDLRAAADRMAAVTADICEFIVSRANIDDPARRSPDAAPVTCHDPCHLGKGLGITQAPRRLISANPSHRLVEMDGADRCCGMGGSFNLSHYALSRQIGERKLDAIAKTRCCTVAAGCPACMMQLADLVSCAGLPIAVRHPIEIYAEALPGSGRPSSGS